MNNQEVNLKSFLQATACLPQRLQSIVMSISDQKKVVCEEVRMRAGKPLSITLDYQEEIISNVIISAQELQETVSRAARYSVHSYGQSLAQGFLPLEGGHRLGVCGTVILKSGTIAGIRNIAALNLRIARQVPGASKTVLGQVLIDKTVRSTLVISPPGFGKTTLLRDVIQQLSSQGVRISVADERGELAAMRDGVPQFDLGTQTDIMDGCPKAQGVMILLKTMSPMVIALDEITAPEDVEAIAYAGHCGVSVLATAHAVDTNDLSRRPLYKKLLALGVFEQIIIIERTNGKQSYKLVTCKEEL